MRRWFTIPIELPILQKSNTAVIELWYEQDAENKGFIDVYGDYPGRQDSKFFIGPSFAKSLFETSIMRYFQEGDCRIPAKVGLDNISTASQLFNGKKWLSFDLSGSLGVQNGSYRIRLEITDNSGNSHIL
jgi:hypothetical protein